MLFVAVSSMKFRTTNCVIFVFHCINQILMKMYMKMYMRLILLFPFCKKQQYRSAVSSVKSNTVMMLTVMAFTACSSRMMELNLLLVMVMAQLRLVKVT